MDKQMTISAFSDELAQVRTKKKAFLDQIERIVPWKEWLTMIQPCYYKGERGPVPHLPPGRLRLCAPEPDQHHDAGRGAGVLHAHRGAVFEPGDAGAAPLSENPCAAADFAVCLLVPGVRPGGETGGQRLRRLVFLLL